MPDVLHGSKEKAMQQERTSCARLVAIDALVHPAIFSYAQKALVVHVDACLPNEKRSYECLALCITKDQPWSLAAEDIFCNGGSSGLFIEILDSSKTSTTRLDD